MCSSRIELSCSYSSSVTMTINLLNFGKIFQYLNGSDVSGTSDPLGESSTIQYTNVRSTKIKVSCAFLKLSYQKQLFAKKYINEKGKKIILNQILLTLILSRSFYCLLFSWQLLFSTILKKKNLIKKLSVPLSHADTGIIQLPGNHRQHRIFAWSIK